MLDGLLSSIQPDTQRQEWIRILPKRTLHAHWLPERDGAYVDRTRFQELATL